MKKITLLITVAFILISFVISIYLYPQFPDRVASHWNSQGEVDGHMSKFWGLFLLPILLSGCLLLFIFLPKFDPLKTNIDKFRKYYDGFIIIFTLFMFYIYLLTIFWNLGHRFDMGQMMVPGLAVLFFYCGVLIGNAKMNWFIGIRTPWTLSSEEVWEKTHKLGGKLFKGAGVIILLGLIWPEYTFTLIMIPILIAARVPIVYSYMECRKEKKG